MSLPIQNSHAHYLSIAKAIRYLTEHQSNQPSLKEIASFIGMSEFHFQRVFSEWAGLSPKQFLLFLTKENAKQKLHKYSVMQSALDNGLSGSNRLHDLFISHESVTPGEFKSQGQGLNISYGIHSCMFGYCLIAITPRGICKLAFFDMQSEKDLLLRELDSDWKNALIQHNNQLTEPYYRRIFLNERSKEKPIHLLLKGTPFKLKVWQALLDIPEGQLASYSHIAQAIKSPNAVRAVASAIANNPIAYLIPCHRVIRHTGVLNEYRWGKTRKAAMIVSESSLQ